MDFGAQGYKPENALRRAEELVQQEQPVRALVTLHEVISNKRYRVWQGSLEDIMMKHIDLCIGLRKGKYARDGLIQYRAICQQVNVGSLEKVINHFLENADQKAKDAQDKSEIKVTEIMADHDLDAEGETLEEAPETLIMKAVSGESTKDRTDREILMPWIKFLWESYRTALDVTRTNPKLEHIYHDTARKAFKFCLSYQRKVEFRKLCDLIRTHHNQQSKYHNPEQRLQLMNNSESFHRYMETRFKQLQVATSLDLWQEAYRSIEDIHGIITFFKKTPQQKQMMEYFDKLTKVFWVAKNYLFHAYACLKYQSLHSRQPPAAKGKEISPEEQQTVASKVLLSILCIPFWERKNYNRQKDELFVYNMSREKNMRITTLLGSSTIPTRSSLLMDLNNRKICEVVFKPLKELYEVLEVQFDPLHLCHRIPAVLEFLSTQPKLEGYGEILKQVAAVRMVEQVCKVYDTMKIDDLVKLCPYYTFAELEPILVEVAKSGYPGINLAINHQTQTISFTDNQLDCDLLSGELSLLNRKLEPVVAQCIAATAPPKKPSGFSMQYFNSLAAQLQSERHDILERKKVIEERKERQEQFEREQARENDVIETKKLEDLKNSEAKRMKEEAAAREEQRKKAQEQQEAEQQTRALYTEIVQQKGGVHLKNLVKADESIIRDPDKLIDAARAQLMLAKEEREKRLKDESKRMDYFERACREEERPILEKLWNERIAQELANAQQTFETQKKEHREQWEHSIEEKKRLSKMESYLDAFRKELIQERKKRIEEERKASKKGKRKEQVQQEEEDVEEHAQENGGEERDINADLEDLQEEEEEEAPPPVSKPKAEARSSSPQKEKKEAAPASGGWRDQAEPSKPTPAPASGGDAKPGAYVPPSQRKAYVPPGKR